MKTTSLFKPSASENTIEQEAMRVSAQYKQIFTVEEALIRLGQNHLTGEFLVINNQESVQIFVEDGMVIHAHAIDRTGEAALLHGLDLADSNFVWIAGAAPFSHDLHIDLGDYLLRRSLSRDVYPEQNISAQKRETLALPRKTATHSPADDLVDPLESGYFLVPEKNPNEKMALKKQVNLLGREIYCDLVLNDSRVSRKHCLVQLTSHGVLVRDLGTINGTYVNGKVIGDTYLNVHDKLNLGGYVLTLKREQPMVKPAKTVQQHATVVLR